MTSKKTALKQSRPILPDSRIFEEDGRIILRLEMPGVTKDGLDIKIDGNVLNISGKRSEDDLIKGEYLVKERQSGSTFLRTYTIDDTIDKDKIDASINNGVLSVTLTLKEAEKPRQITVKTG